MSRKIPLTTGETCRTTCVPALVHSGVDEKTGEALAASALAERVGWAAELVSPHAV